METKRCAQCHKLLRAETQTCSRCGYTFPETKRRRQTKSLPRPSLPPASPHRAGHYSGLHPEDQPYQSNMVAIQRPPAHEPEEIPSFVESLGEEQEREQYNSFFDDNDEDDIPTVITARQERPQTEASMRRINPPLTPRMQQVQPVPPPARQTQYEQRLTETEGTLLALHQPSLQRRKPARRGRVIPLLLTLSCIFFLLASGILVYALTVSRATSSSSLSMSASPDTLRVGDTVALSGKGLAPATQIKFTHDDAGAPIYDSMKQQLEAMTNHHGTFAVDMIVPTDWSPGQHAIHVTDEAQQSSASATITVLPPSTAPPQLQLPVTHIDMGSDRAGTTSSKQITLKNVGGGELAWQSSSDATWLTASPISNSYVFSGSSPITITANRSKLTPQTYTGHITFTQKSSNITAKLTVTMKVDSAPAALNISTSELTFSTTAMQTVPNQNVTLQNSGGNALNWQAVATTSNSTNWLYLVGASNGSIDAKQSQQLVVGVQAQQLAVGTYQGAITLTGGASATITVSLTVVAPGNILVSPLALSFTSLTGQATTSKTLTVQNSGGEARDWSVGITPVSQGNWLSVTPASGTVAVGEATTVTVNINSAILNAGSYSATLIFTGGSQTTQIPVSLTVTTPPAPVISVQATTLTFQTTQGTDPIGQFLTITNTGNALLNWTASESGAGATFAPLMLYSGSLMPQTHVDIEVNPRVSTYKAETLATTITFADSDVGTTVVSQKVPVIVVIQSQAAISASPSNFSLDTSGPGTNTQAVTITNTGSAPLNWASFIHVDEPVGGAWLAMSATRGTLASGASTTVTVTCSSTGLQKGTYYGGSIQIGSSDAGITVTPQMIYVSFYP